MPEASCARTCASWSNSLLKQLVHTSRYLSLVIKCRYLRDSPVLLSIIVFENWGAASLACPGTCPGMTS